MNPAEIAQYIRVAIRKRELAPGTVLVQEQLAEKVGTSRMPLRDALMALAVEGVVDKVPSGGFRVAAPSPEGLQELANLRLMIEPTMAPAIVDNASPRFIKQLRDCQQQMEEIGPVDIGGWAEMNYTFHRLLYDIPGMPYTSRIGVQILELCQPSWRTYENSVKGLASGASDHWRIIDAVAARDPEELRAAMAAHVSSAGDFITQQVLAQSVR